MPDSSSDLLSTESSETRGEVTRLLRAWSDGDDDSRDRLMALLYDELRRLAGAYMRRHGNITLQATAVVNEAYLRLVDLDIAWNGRPHFFAVASTLMRRILVDEARRRNAKKRGGEAERVGLDDADFDRLTAARQDRQLIALDDALKALAETDPRKARAVELRFFGGLTLAETAEVMGLASATVERDLKAARAWLATEIAEP